MSFGSIVSYPIISNAAAVLPQPPAALAAAAAVAKAVATARATDIAVQVYSAPSA